MHRSWASEIYALRSWASAQFAAAWLLTAVGLFADGFRNKQNFRIFSDISDSLLQVTRPSFISAFTPGCAPSTSRVQGTALRRAQRNSVGRKKREPPASRLQASCKWEEAGIILGIQENEQNIHGLKELQGAEWESWIELGINCVLIMVHLSLVFALMMSCIDAKV